MGNYLITKTDIQFCRMHFSTRYGISEITVRVGKAIAGLKNNFMPRNKQKNSVLKWVKNGFQL